MVARWFITEGPDQPRIHMSMGAALHFLRHNPDAFRWVVVVYEYTVCKIPVPD